MNIDEAKNLAYMLDRREHTARIMIETNPLVVEVINTEGEMLIQSRAEDMPKQGFNGA